MPWLLCPLGGLQRVWRRVLRAVRVGCLVPPPLPRALSELTEQEVRGLGVAWPGLLEAGTGGRSHDWSCLQAEEELVKAQKVFEEMNVDLQEELPSLWNR